MDDGRNGRVLYVIYATCATGFQRNSIGDEERCAKQQESCREVRKCSGGGSTSGDFTESRYGDKKKEVINV